MHAEREQIYRRILYTGLVDIRNLSYCATNGQPFAPRLTAADCMACVAELAEWLHVLAGCARDFSKLDKEQEEFLALCYRGYSERFPPAEYPVLVHQVVALLG